MPRHHAHPVFAWASGSAPCAVAGPYLNLLVCLVQPKFNRSSGIAAMLLLAPLLDRGQAHCKFHPAQMLKLMASFLLHVKIHVWQ
jgi:hypothetical protein